MQLDRQYLSSRLPSRPALQDELLQPAPRSAGESESAAKLLHVLWRRRWIVIACVVASLVASIFYLAKAVPIYSSASRVFVQQTGPKIMTDDVLGRGSSTTFLFNQIELIRSPAILGAASKKPAMRTSKTLAQSDNPIGVLLSMVTVELGKQNDIITLSAESPYPDEAALIVNSVVDAYIDYQASQQHSTLVEVVNHLQTVKDERDAELDRISKAMMEFKRDNGVLSFENEKGNIVTQRLAELSEALGAAQMDTLNAKVMKEAVEAIGDDSTKIKQLMQAEYAKGVQINVGADSGDLASQVKQLKLRIANMAAKYGREFPGVVDSQNELNEMQSQLDAADLEAATNARAVIEQVFLKSVRKEDALRAAFEEQKKLALDLASKSAEFSKLDSDQRRTEKLSDALDARIKEINVSEDTGVLNTSILEIARASGTPVRPIRSKTLGIALVAGLMLGFAGALIQDWMDQRIRSADEIAEFMDISVLGLIPSIQGKGGRSDRGREVDLRPRSDIAEAYRTIRTAIYFGGTSTHCKTVLVTSPSPGDGKSTVASNLSIAMAQAGERVLLIDADCRRPVQHKTFKIDGTIGLTTVMGGETTFDKAIVPTGIKNLDMLVCGPVPTNPAEMLNSAEFSQLLDELESRYDHIVLDSPPVIPITDARILAASVHATILVLRAEKSTRRLSKHALESLRDVGGSVLGAVVNDVPRNRGRYGYYAYYGGYYASHYGPDGQPNGEDLASEKVNGSKIEANGHPAPLNVIENQGENAKT